MQVHTYVGNNKNSFMLAFLVTLVALGVVETVQVDFMMAAHTHTKIDPLLTSCASSVAAQLDDKILWFICTSREKLGEWNTSKHSSLHVPVDALGLHRLMRCVDLAFVIPRSRLARISPNIVIFQI